MDEKQEVWVFYSGERESDLLRFYGEGIAYLHDSGIKTHTIDVMKNPELAEKHKIIATPVLLIKKDEEKHKYVGIIDGLKQLLMNDLYGLSVLHALGFKEGRQLARKLELAGRGEKREIEQTLKENLGSRGIHDFTLLEFNLKKRYAKVSLKSEFAKEHWKSETTVCMEISSFLGGIFTEIFDVGVLATEENCIAQGFDYCEFEIKETAEEHKKEIKEMVRKAIK